MVFGPGIPGPFFLTLGFCGSIMTAVFGLVAQLGAHRIRIAGVGSSNLLESTKYKDPHVRFRVHGDPFFDLSSQIT